MILVEYLCWTYLKTWLALSWYKGMLFGNFNPSPNTAFHSNQLIVSKEVYDFGIYPSLPVPNSASYWQKYILKNVFFESLQNNPKFCRKSWNCFGIWPKYCSCGSIIRSLKSTPDGNLILSLNILNYALTRAVFLIEM